MQPLTGWKPLVRYVLDAGSVAGLLSLFYTIANNLRDRPRLAFEFLSKRRSQLDEQNMTWLQVNIEGYLKNKSYRPSSLTHVLIVIWANKRRNRTLTMYDGPTSVCDLSTNSELRLPIALEPKEAKRLDIRFKIPLTGQDLVLASETVQITAGSPFRLPKWDYELALEDLDGNFFDQGGRLRSRREVNLRWELPNTFEALKTGNPCPLLLHYSKILLARMAFATRRLLSSIGLWR